LTLIFARIVLIRPIFSSHACRKPRTGRTERKFIAETATRSGWRLKIWRYKTTMPEISDDNEDFSIQKIPVEDLYEKALSIYMNSRDLLIEISQFLDSKN
jgi:hypothetical protein